MHLPSTTAGRSLAVLTSLLLLHATPSLAQSNFTRSAKRGLIFIPNSATPQDNTIWTEPGSDLTWYYNYDSQPSPALESSSLQFVPMLFSPPASTTDTTFLDGVKSLISAGTNISYALGFNEPDGTTATGGSAVQPNVAAAAWIRELEPLRTLGVKLGAPAVTGGEGGFTWLQEFFTACNGSCHADFIPIHWYGDFGGLASHIGQVRAAYQNSSIWITEYALPNASLSDTQSFFNESAQYYDRIDYITHYSYFGSFRSPTSNVGPNASMLDQDGRLTDIGSWYLGGKATGDIPLGSGGVRIVGGIGGGWGVVAVVVGVMGVAGLL